MFSSEKKTPRSPAGRFRLLGPPTSCRPHLDRRHPVGTVWTADILSAPIGPPTSCRHHWTADILSAPLDRRHPVGTVGPPTSCRHHWTADILSAPLDRRHPVGTVWTA